MATKKYLDNNGLAYLWQKIVANNPNVYDGILTIKQNGTVVQTFSANQSGNVNADISVPTKTSDLNNDSGFITSSALPTVNNATLTIQKNGTTVKTFTANASADVTANITVPTNNNQLTNGAGYQTANDVQTAITSAISGIVGVKFEVVVALPATGDAGTIYLVSNSGTTPNIYDEYIYVNNSWEKIGTTDVDLSGYVQDADLVAITNAEIDAIVADESE